MLLTPHTLQTSGQQVTSLVDKPQKQKQVLKNEAINVTTGLDSSLTLKLKCLLSLTAPAHLLQLKSFTIFYTSCPSCCEKATSETAQT